MVPCGEYWVPSRMRHAGVFRMAADRECDRPARRHYDVIVDRDGAGIESGSTAKAENLRHGKPVEEAGCNHCARATIALLGWLEVNTWFR